MKLINYKQLIKCSLGLLAIVIFSCKEDEQDLSFEPKRMFTPTTVTTTNGETQAKIEWSPSLFSQEEGTTYTLEVSKEAGFQTIDHTVTVDTTVAFLTDENLAIKQPYFARVKANATGASAESNWMVSPEFMITGEQIFAAVSQSDIEDKTVLLKWRATTGLTKIVISPAGGTAMEIALSEDDIAARQKLITGLTPSTSYNAEIFAGTKIKGATTFTTKELNIYAATLNPTDDLIATIANAANNDIIGLEPGIYDYTALDIPITEKHITIQSTSGNPNDTKVLFQEFTLKGNGAGVKLAGIDFDGTTVADYFINVDAEPATLTSITIDNAIIHNTKNCLIRGNRAAANAQKIDFIKVNNCVAYDNGTGSYDYIQIDKMEINTLELTNSTFYNSGRRLVGWSTNLSKGPSPVILLSNLTVNNFGYGGRDYILVDTNNNNATITIQNSIFANTPKPGQTSGANALRTGSNSTVRFNNNNTFNFTGGDPAAALIFPNTVQINNRKTVDLGWTATTTNFALPAGSELRTASTTGGPIGDPRWAQ